jgi:hypothetical protein
MADAVKTPWQIPLKFPSFAGLVLTILDMKTMFSLVALAFVLAAAGCSTPRSVAELQGQGAKEVYNATYNHVWNAAVASAQMGDLYILHTDKPGGFISAKRSLRPETFGENVAIWVRSISPTQTEVEVISRQAGPPVLIMRNWEKRILASIEASLTTQKNAMAIQFGTRKS